MNHFPRLVPISIIAILLNFLAVEHFFCSSDDTETNIVSSPMKHHVIHSFNLREKESIPQILKKNSSKYINDIL